MQFNHLRRTLAASALALSGLTSYAQAYDWILPPSTRIHFNPSSLTVAGSFAVTSLPAGSGIASCHPGPGAVYDELKFPTVVSDETGTGMAFINYCGIYNTSGSSIASSTPTYQNVFAVPGVCKRYYSIQWETSASRPTSNSLVLHKLDATNPASITEIGTGTNVIYDGYEHFGMNVAAAPLAANETRKIYITDDVQLKSVTIARDGSIGAVATLATLPDRADNRLAMEVSPDGQKVLIGFYNYIMVYDVATGSLTKLGTFGVNTVISGMEYVPYPGGDRIYISYHTAGGATGLDYVLLSAPTVLNTALGSMGSMTASGFGFSEIELGANGLLYATYHPGYGTGDILSGSVGTLCSIEPTLGNVNVVMNGAAAVNVTTLINRYGYIIQRQIDGENYNKTNYSTAVANFDVAGISSSMAGPYPDLYLCNNKLPINSTITGYHSGYTVTVEVGLATYIPGPGWKFATLATQPSPNSYTVSSISLTHTSDISSHLSFLSTYTGAVKVTVTPIGDCGAGTSLSKVYNVKGNTATYTDYKALTYLSGGTFPSKSLMTTVPIPDRTFITTSPAAFRTDVNSAIGWNTPYTTNGIGDITTDGDYTCKVYEVNSVTGLRQRISGVDAPDIITASITGAATGGQLDFFDNTLEFSAAGGPFYYDAAAGHTGEGWFREYYKWAYSNSKLAEYSAKHYCVEVTVTTSTGCVDVKKSYFRVAARGTTDGYKDRTLKPGAALDVSEVNVYPNPAKDQFQVNLPFETKAAKIVLRDMLGRTVLAQDNILSGFSFDISQLTAGTYIYQVVADGIITQGKLVKQ
jgi:hypothetical protein